MLKSRRRIPSIASSRMLPPSRMGIGSRLRIPRFRLSAAISDDGKCALLHGLSRFASNPDNALELLRRHFAGNELPHDVYDLPGPADGEIRRGSHCLWEPNLAERVFLSRPDADNPRRFPFVILVGNRGHRERQRLILAPHGRLDGLASRLLDG